jgi:hypothetical protein
MGIINNNLWQYLLINEAIQNATTADVVVVNIVSTENGPVKITGIPTNK